MPHPSIPIISSLSSCFRDSISYSTRLYPRSSLPYMFNATVVAAAVSLSFPHAILHVSCSLSTEHTDTHQQSTAHHTDVPGESKALYHHRFSICLCVCETRREIVFLLRTSSEGRDSGWRTQGDEGNRGLVHEFRQIIHCNDADARCLSLSLFPSLTTSFTSFFAQKRTCK